MVPKIIDVPYGTYLGQVTDISAVKIKDKDYVQLQTEIVYGEWHDFFGAATKAKKLGFSEGCYNCSVAVQTENTTRISDYIKNYPNRDKILIAVEIDKVRFGKENQYHNITNLYDWRTCDTLPSEAKAWAEEHCNDDVYDNIPTAYDMLPYALQYAQAGLRVFPLSPCDKTPLKGSKGLHEATNNIGVIKQWWTSNPFYNIGCATGNGIAVIDIDEGTDNNGKSKSGEDSIAQWQSENGQLPDTLTAISGKGGRHLYYRTGNKYSSKAGVIKNVDVRAEGGYIVLPPSIHPNGNRYSWVGDFGIDKIASADQTVSKILSLGCNKTNNISLSTISNKLILQTDILDRLNFDEGSRNDSLYRFGCSLQGKGVSDVDVFNELTRINLSRCNPPLSVQEVNSIYNSVISKPKGDKASINKSKTMSNDSVIGDDNNVSTDDTFTIVRNISDLGDLEFEDYVELLASVYPYVTAHKSKDNTTIYYSINLHKLAAYIRRNDDYFFIEGVGDKPVPYWYKKGYYQQCSDLVFLGEIKKYIEIFDEQLVEPSELNKVYKLLQTDLYNKIEANRLNADSNIINFANGLLHLDTLTLHPHTPAIYSTIQIPCSWNPQALSSPVFNNFLHTLSNGDKSVKKLLWEYIGYAVSNIPGYKCKQALILYGAGNTGKSQYLSLLEKLIGPENYCSMSLQQLEMRFGTSALWGKRLAGNADMGSAKIDELEKFKARTGGDTIDYEFKGKDRFSAKYTGLLIFCCNNLPKFGGDRGEHVYDRMITLPCNNVVPFEKRDRELIDKIYAEREAIIYHSVIALKKLVERGGYFEIPEVCRVAREEYKTSNDNVRQFLIDCTDHSDIGVVGKGINQCTKTSAMYEYYKRWCSESGFAATNRREFRRGIENFFGKKIDSIEFVYNGNKYYPFVLKNEMRQNYYSYGY